MMPQKMPELYFTSDLEWREWLNQHHYDHPQGVYLILYAVNTAIPSMRWDEAVRVALCYGWIDSTAKNIGEGKRRQYFCPRTAKSSWSARNKKHLKELENLGLIHKSGRQAIANAKENGSWAVLDDVENLILPMDLKKAFSTSPEAFENYENFSPSYRKAYLRWLNQAKREITREKRIKEIVLLCKTNKKSKI